MISVDLPASRLLTIRASLPFAGTTDQMAEVAAGVAGASIAYPQVLTERADFVPDLAAIQPFVMSFA